MEIVNKSKWNLRMAVLAIFALGFVAGALSLNIYRSYSFGRRGHFDQMLDRLQLTSEQRTQVEKILSDARVQLMDEQRQRMREVREQTDQRLQTVLTPEQWEKFKQMRGEMGDWRRRRGRRF
jgi:Spy/CpxP family protein refolding chaperone